MFDPGQSDLPDFFRRHEVEVVSSLPYFLEQQTDAQRGHGVFHKSIEALLRLNAVGYGVDGSSFVLNLVYNPVGAFLPPPQASIEADFNRVTGALRRVVNHLYTIANMPIKRFLDYLRRSGKRRALHRRRI